MPPAVCSRTQPKPWSCLITPPAARPALARAGKTTFIKYLLGRDYPGTHIGPEPTTDRFVVVSELVRPLHGTINQISLSDLYMAQSLCCAMGERLA